jgi:Carboxylesterase family
MYSRSVRRALGTSCAAVSMIFVAAATARAQVPPDIEAGLRKIGQIVDPGCTAKLYRPLMPVNDYNTYWPPGASAPANVKPLYPGITVARDQPFGPNTKDVVDIFSADRGGDNRPVLIYVPGGAGNKIEQQAREANAFYDNIGRWAAKNGMVGVTVQRHPGTGNWDDGGRDISLAVDWVKANIKKYKGNPERMFIWAHSAGNGPLGVYVGHPERWKDGVSVRGAIFMSGNPVPGLGGNPGGGRGPGAPGGAPPAGGPPAAGGGGRGNAPPSTCGVAANSSEGAISGPSGVTPPDPNAAGRRGGARGGGQPLDAAAQAERDNLPGFKKTDVKIMLARAELDPGVSGAMTAADIALHDELCKLDGARAKDGVGHCPAMLFAKGESHMSEVFSIDTKDLTVSGPILAWIKNVK